MANISKINMKSIKNQVLYINQMFKKEKKLVWYQIYLFFQQNDKRCKEQIRKQMSLKLLKQGIFKKRSLS